MANIAFASRNGAIRISPRSTTEPKIHLSDGNLRGRQAASLLGVQQRRQAPNPVFVEATEEAQAKPAATASPLSAVLAGETVEKVVRRMPTLYVIALFGVMVLCAVFTIWNTLQVNKLTLERTRGADRLAQTEQRLIKLRAEEMQLTAPSRIRELAQTKLGMEEERGENLVIVK